MASALPALAEVPAKLSRQLKQILKKAISFWKTIQDLLTFHGVDDGATAQKLQSLHKVSVSQLQTKPRGSKRIMQQLAEAMRLSVKNLRTVAEIYNPGCFNQFVKKHGLEPGLAFDIALEVDLLCPDIRLSSKLREDHQTWTSPCGATMAYVLATPEFAEGIS